MSKAGEVYMQAREAGERNENNKSREGEKIAAGEIGERCHEQETEETRGESWRRGEVGNGSKGEGRSR